MSIRTHGCRLYAILYINLKFHFGHAVPLINLVRLRFGIYRMRGEGLVAEITLVCKSVHVCNL